MALLKLLMLGILVPVLLCLLVWWILKKSRSGRLESLYTDSVSFPNNRSQYHVIEDRKLHYIIEGRGPFLFLIHGIGANIYSWRYLIAKLAPHFTVCAVDIPGFGESETPQTGYSVQNQARRLLVLLEHLDVKEAFVMGSSMGGAIACEMVIQKPALFHKVILISSAHDTEVVPVNLTFMKHFTKVAGPLMTPLLMKTILKYVYGKKFHSQITDEMIAAYLKPFLRSDETMRAFFSSFETLKDSTLTERYLRVKKDTLVIWGEVDKITPIEFGKKLSAELAKGKLVVHPEAGHHVHEEDPDWLYSQILPYLNS